MLYHLVTPDNVIHSGPKLDVTSVQWLTINDFWDGPLEGSILVEGRRYWAIHVDENKWHLFYDEYEKRVRPDYSGHEIAWWFEN